MTHQREQVEETWEERWDAKFYSKHDETCTWHRNVDIKIFIRELLAIAVKQRDEEVIKMIEGMPKNFPDIESNEYDAGYTAACQDIKALLTKDN